MINGGAQFPCICGMMCNTNRFFLKKKSSLESPFGNKIFGLPSLQGFHVFFPDAQTWLSSSPTGGPQAILLIHKWWTSLSIQYRQDLSITRDICTVVMNVNWMDRSPCPLYISSCYNASANESNTLDTKLGRMNIPPEANWILGGDFNRHHPDWSA